MMVEEGSSCSCGSPDCAGCAPMGPGDVAPLDVELDGSDVQAAANELDMAVPVSGQRPPHRLVTKRLRR
jgi:hypothetical protein